MQSRTLKVLRDVEATLAHRFPKGKMEKLTLIPQSQEILVNNGSPEGAVDIFSYGPESEESLRPYGALYVIGHRDTDSSNMGYMVSLIAALARREYYGQPGATPRDAFARTLKKINEVVEEFFKSSGVNLSVGIFAIAGGTVIVSKLDKFKILLAREGQVIDILNNVMLFSKEHLEKRKFSSIISGSVQPGDRLLAYYPAKTVVTRERYLKSYLLKLPAAEFVSKIADIGREHATFAAAMLHIDMLQTAQEAISPQIQPEELKERLAPAPVQKVRKVQPAQPAPQVALAWKPRQAAEPLPIATPVASPPPAPKTLPTEEPEELEAEVPHIIPTEFSLGTRRSRWGRWTSRLHLVRLDTRGKLMFLGTSVCLIVVAIVIAKSFLFVSPEQKKMEQALGDIRNDLKLAQSEISQNNPGPARQILVRALATLSGSLMDDSSDAKELSASIVQVMDTLDNAQDATVSLMAQTDEKTDRLLNIAWSSSSHSLWAVSTDTDGGLAVVELKDGQIAGRTTITDIQPSAIMGFNRGALIIDATARTVLRVMDGTTKTFTLPTQESILDAFVYEGGLYVLTNASILKVSDLDTDKPVTKQWLTNGADLAADAARIYVDGSIRTLSRTGELTLYYKGKKTSSVATPFEPSGIWKLIAGPQENELVLTNADTQRIHLFNAEDGQLIRTLKLDTKQTLLGMEAGPDGSVLILSKDSKVWRTQ